MMQVPRCKGICRICQPQILIYHLLTMIINLFSPLQPPSFDKEAIRTVHDPRMHEFPWMNAVISPHPWNQPSSTHDGFFQSMGAVHRVSQGYVCMYLHLYLYNTFIPWMRNIPRNRVLLTKNKNPQITSRRKRLGKLV